MIQVQNIKLNIDSDISSLRKKVCRLLKINDKNILSFEIARKSIDARQKESIFFVYSVNLSLNIDERLAITHSGCKSARIIDSPSAYVFGKANLSSQPVVIGAGPAGLFAALALARSGAKPILIERGEDVDSRINRVNLFWKSGELDPSSNVQFGEGGAGTFSDGKLTTGTSDIRNITVLKTFVDCGAPAEIMYLHKPHIGTDKLVDVVRNLRKKIIEAGGSVYFRRSATGFRIQSGVITGVEYSDIDGSSGIINTDKVVLAVGHSARDVFFTLSECGANIEAKPFSVGVRIEHLQSSINRAQYGERFASHPALPAADYKLSCHMPDGRGVYTFCMCPGGTVVAAASEHGGVVTNGMSRYARDEANANSALLVGVSPDDFGTSPLSGVEFQRTLEHSAYIAGGRNYRAPAQTVDSFLTGSTTNFGKVKPSYRPGVVPTDLNTLLPEYISHALKYGLSVFDKRLHGFASPDSVMTGFETRTSSPVRIVRDSKSLESNIKGLYPCGEGAGYAGGIMSAAVDGLRVAEAIIQS